MRRIGALVLAVAAAAACSGNDGATGPDVAFQQNPCATSGTLQLAEMEAARVDCGNGGTTVTVAGNGASYLVVAEFPSGQGANTRVGYRIAARELTAAAQGRIVAPVPGAGGSAALAGLPAGWVPNVAQAAADRLVLQRMAEMARRGAVMHPGTSAVQRNLALAVVPTVGSLRSFQVYVGFFSPTVTYKSVGARLQYAGNNVLIYVDTLAPANGFTSTQLQQFGDYFDQTLYPITVSAFGQPSDVDQNGHVIMLMSPAVNSSTPAGTCASQGYVAGFFNAQDFNGPSDSHSNQGEIFYSIVPDPLGTFSCAHSVESLGSSVPATFMHELQHLISYSQHAVIGGGAPVSSWLDEGLSLIAEELGSLYYEAKCPPPACRTNPEQIFPDSSQGFVSNFLFDSYAFALRPDTASLTLHDDSQPGLAWRGGEWLLFRWLGDHHGSGFYKALETGPSDGIGDIEAAAGESFPSLLAKFGITLHTDSLPGLPRSAVPAELRFVTRNVKALWARLFTIAGPSAEIPLADPVQLTPITSTATLASMVPGTAAYYRLDTPGTAATITVQFAAQNGKALPASLHPQLAIFRLPAGP